MPTITEVLEHVGVSVPNELDAHLATEFLPGLPQRQGDVNLTPLAPLDTSKMSEADAADAVRFAAEKLAAMDEARFETVPREGVAVVAGENSGNTHILHALEGTVEFYRCEDRSDPSNTAVGYIRVPEGSQAWLVHTDEHGQNALGSSDGRACTYFVSGKREQADVIRRVAD